MRLFLLAFAAISAVRLLTAVILPVADCDEVFNYFEPAHFLLTGYGKQTWEYASQYALRSWAFVWMYLGPAVASYKLLEVSDRYMLYIIMRGTPAVVSAFFEACFVSAAAFRFGPTIRLPMLLFIILSPGAQTSSSFLPSSFAMVCLYASGAAWLLIDGLNRREFDVLCAVVWPAVVAALLGWPFAALVAVPIGLDVLWRSGLLTPLIAAAQAALVVGSVMVAVDTAYYGYGTFSSWNIVAYNVFGSEGRGPELYGVEPWSFFFKNLALNFNLVFLLALSLPLLLVLHPGAIPDPRAAYTTAINNAPLKLSKDEARAVRAGTMTMPIRQQEAPTVPLTKLRVLVYASPFYVWFAFWLRIPHKEERFMAPAYPFLILAAAMAVHTLQHATNSRTWTKRLFLLMRVIGLAVFCVLSIARLDAMSANFGGIQQATIEAREWLHLAVPSTMESSRRPTLCLGVDWYRFPSSFFLPTRWRYCFLKTSAFSGALPLDFGGDTRKPRHNMNDLNYEIPEQYCAVSECDAVLDTLAPGTGSIFTIADGAIPSTDLSIFPQEHAVLDAGASGFLCRAFSFGRYFAPGQCSWRRVVVGVIRKAAPAVGL